MVVEISANGRAPKSIEAHLGAGLNQGKIRV